MNIEKTTINIPTEKIYPFEGHPYKVQDNEEMNLLIESIQANGVLSPIIVRPKENTTDEYEVISGHRRLRAVTKAGIKTIPAIIMPIDRDSAAIAVVDSNLHRENILPSEKAFAYKLKLEAMKHQGKRTDLTSTQLVSKLRSDETIGKSTDESRETIRRYIRLTNLIPPILDMVDEGRIAFTPAVELSYLAEDEQQDLLETIESEDCTPSLSQAQQMKKLSQEGALTMDSIFEIMTKIKGNQKEYLKIPAERYSHYLDKLSTPKDKEAFVMKALEHYTRYLQKKRNLDAR